LVISAIGLLVAAFGAVPIAIAAVGFAIGFFIVRALQSVNWTAFLTAATNAFGAIVSAVSGVANGIVGGFNDAAILISNAFFTSVQFVTDLWNGLLAFFAALPATVGGYFVSVGEAIKAAFFDAVSAIKGFFDDLWLKATGIFNNIISAAQRVASAVKSAVSGGAGSSDVQGPGFARGGPMRGPGTGTSDSILAWLSNKEYVMSAKATAFWGEGFMNSILNLKNPFAGFSMGGFVDALSPRGYGGLPAYAGGGLATAGIAEGGGTPVHFTLPSGKSVGPMMTGKEVMRLLKLEAVSAGMMSGGRKPNFVGR
jgi:hypothetical protein